MCGSVRMQLAQCWVSNVSIALSRALSPVKLDSLYIVVAFAHSSAALCHYVDHRPQ